MINKSILVGRLGKDPEMKYTPSGMGVANFSLATDYSAKNSDGNYEKKTEWHNIVVFNKAAEFAAQYLNKGSLVYIEGRIQTRSWEDQTGNKRYMTEIIADKVQALGSKSDSEPKTKAQVAQEETQANEPDDDQLPF